MSLSVITGRKDLVPSNISNLRTITGGRQKNAQTGEKMQGPPNVSSKAANDQHISRILRPDVKRWGPVPVKDSYKDLAQRLKRQPDGETESHENKPKDHARQSTRSVIVEVDVKKFVPNTQRERAESNSSSTISGNG